MPGKRRPELTFQEHIAAFLVRVHGYGLLEQTDITDTEHCIAEDQLWAFLNATQADTLKKLTDDYSTNAQEDIELAAGRYHLIGEEPGGPVREGRGVGGTEVGRAIDWPTTFAANGTDETLARRRRQERTARLIAKPLGSRPNTGA